MFIKRSYRKKILLRIIVIFIAFFVIGSTTYGSYIFLNEQHIAQEKKQADDKRIALAKLEATKKAAIEAKKKEPVYITLPGAKKIRAILEDYTLPNSIWAIVSKTHEISVDYIPDSLKIPDVSTRTDKSNEERSVRSDIELSLKKMFEDASIAKNLLMIGSGYRSANLQAVYFNSLAKSVGEEVANQSIARPGQSEHQTGLAVDISAVSRNCYLDTCFATTNEGRWLADNSYKYGFILRYPEDKVDITGYQYEPWHFRYVGIDLATALHDSDLTLDEAWPYLKTARDTLVKNGAIN